MLQVCSLLTVLPCLLKLCDSAAVSAVKGSLIVTMTTPAAGTSLHLEVARACDAEATLTLTWTSKDSSGSPSTTCDLSYYPSGDKSPQTMDILFKPHPHSIRLFNLTLGQSYTAVVACGPVMKTNQVSFISDRNCEDLDSRLNQTLDNSDGDGSPTPVYFDTSTFDVVEWPIAITVILLGIIIAAIVALYMWKKHRRRQRILRIFRQSQNDPFQALYSPTQDSYSF
ncbi:hypothetical protein BsWGS_19649 [Bradybaena similaris]